MWVYDRSESSRVGRLLSHVCNQSKKICSRTCRVSDFTMSEKIICLKILKKRTRLVAVFWTFTMSDGGFVQIDSVFLADISYRSSDSIFLISIDVICFEISEDADSDTAFIIPECMSRRCVISTSTPFVDLSTLTDDVVISDITPSTNH